MQDSHRDTPVASGIYVGPPVLSWSIEEARTKEFATRFREVCKQHIRAARESRELRRVGHVVGVTWATNVAPKIYGWKSIRSAPPGEDIEPIADLLMPYVSALLDASLRAKDARWLLELKSLVDKQICIIDLAKRAMSTPDGGPDTPPKGNGEPDSIAPAGPKEGLLARLQSVAPRAPA